RELLLADLARVVAAPGMAARPVARRVLVDPVEGAGLEALEPRGLVAEVLVDDAIEVEHPATRRQVARPVVRVAPERDVAAPVDPVDPVRAAGDRLVLHDLVEGLAAAPL